MAINSIFMSFDDNDGFNEHTCRFESIRRENALLSSLYEKKDLSDLCGHCNTFSCTSRISWTVCHFWTIFSKNDCL